MKVHEVMTTDVITTSPEAPIHKAARLMVDHGVSGLPVVDEGGALVGLISEGDLILRQKPRERVSWWRSFFDDGERLAREYQKAAGRTVGEVMTRPALAVPPETSLEAAAGLMHQHGIRRLPVTRDGQLVGIISRGDLIKALAAAPREGMAKSDADLLVTMRARMAQEPWTAASNVLVEAHQGVVTLLGVVGTETTRSALATMAGSIDGCVGVDNQLVVRPEFLPYPAGV